MSRLLSSERLLLALLVQLCAFALVYFALLWRVDNLLYDVHLRLWDRPAPADVVIAAVDERSLDRFGHWPWPRRVHAELLNRLSSIDVRGVAMDIVFADADLNDPSGDRVLAEAIEYNGRVVLPVAFDRDATDGTTVEILPLPLFAQRAAGIGDVQTTLDDDGVLRGIALETRFNGKTWPNLALALLRADQPASVQASATGHANGSDLYEIEPELIPFAGPAGRFPRVSVADLLSDPKVLAATTGKWVFLGVTATTLGGAISTPRSGQVTMTGVEVLANTFDALRRGIMIRRMELPWQLLISGILVLLPALLYHRLPLRWTVVTAVAMPLLTLLLAAALSRVWHVWFPPAAAVTLLALSFPLWSWRRLEYALHQLFRERERAQVALRSIDDAVITTDAEGRVRYLNPRAEALLGQDAYAAWDRSLAELPVPSGNRGFEDIHYALTRCLEQGRRIRLPHPTTVQNQGEEERVVHVSAAPIRGSGDEIRGAVLAITDITDLHRMQRELAFQSTHDQLTGLPNRALLRDRLNVAIGIALRQQRGVAVLFFGLDRFQNVNSGLSYNAGDDVLRQLAARLCAQHLPWQTVARVGGDEFVLLLENIPGKATASAAAQKALDDLQAAVNVNEQDVFVTASMGISLFPEDGTDADQLLRNAHAAMYRAKRHSGNNYLFFAQAMSDRSRRRLELTRELKRALEQNQLELYFQPQVAFSDNSLVGAETLIRWHHPEHGPVAPAEFIPLAEETGLIVPIGEWALNAACEQARSWQIEGFAPLPIAVNLSPRQFVRDDVTALVARVLNETGLDPECLALEITESLLMTDIEDAVNVLGRLKSLGVQLAIDDFGTGYSSLGYLRRFPVDYVKIDRSLVQDITVEPGDATIAAAVIGLAHGLELKAIAEGVETAAQHEFLKKKQCDVMQGFYFSGPLSAVEMSQHLRREQAVSEAAEASH